MEINTPARGQEGQETREEREMYTYPPHTELLKQRGL